MAFVIMIACLAAYFLPTIVAVLNSKCTNKIGIFILNLLLGWTFIAWVIALVMACGNGVRETIVINNDNSVKTAK